MTSETLKTYAPCKVHRLWFDQATVCALCLFESADKAPLPEVSTEAQKKCGTRTEPHIDKPTVADAGADKKRKEPQVFVI